MRAILLVLVVGFLALAVLAGVGARQNHVEVEQASNAILGTLVCRKTGEQSWEGTTVIEQPYRLAHGIALIQPNHHRETWKDLTAKGTLRFEGTDDSFEFNFTGDSRLNDGRNEFRVPCPVMQKGTLTLQILGLKAVGPEDLLALDVANDLCGCEKVVGEFFNGVAWTAGIIALILSVRVTKAFSGSRRGGQPDP